MEILLITATFSPDQNPNAFRWGAIVKYLSEQGHFITVLTTSCPNCNPIEETGNMSIIRTGSKTIFDWFSLRLPVKAKSRKASNYRGRVETPSFLYKVLESLADLTWRRLYWPDGSVIWYYPALRSIKKLFVRKKHFDLLVTVSMPFTSALLGRYIKNRFPEIKWIHDVEDPFCLQIHTPKNNLNLFRKKNFIEEQKVLEKADRVVFTNSVIREMYVRVLGIKGKAKVAPPLLFSDRSIKTIQDKNENKIILTYIGSFYAKIREPRVLLDVFNQYFLQYAESREKIRVRIVGSFPKKLVNQLNEYPLLLKNLELTGEVDHGSVQSIMKGSDYLINTGNTTGYQLPSKVVEYMNSKIPIINLCQIPDDSFRIFAAEAVNIFNYRTFLHDQVEELERLNRFILHTPKSENVFDSQKYMVESVIQSYLKEGV